MTDQPLALAKKLARRYVHGVEDLTDDAAWTVASPLLRENLLEISRTAEGHFASGAARQELRPGAVEAMAWVKLPRSAVDVIDAARSMPRQTPAPGGCSTIHDFKIEAGTVWALDRALSDFDADNAVYGTDLVEEHRRPKARQGGGQ